MAKYIGDAIIGVGLSVLAPKPLDDRTVVANLQLLYATNPNYAYVGMTVANLDNGNIYMLTDKSKINNKYGWKASYESILIQTCTEDEYKEWLANTDEDFNPIDEQSPYVHQDTYYYIWEESLSAETEMQEYLRASWGKNIEDLLALKASLTSIVTINRTIEALDTKITNDYATLEHVAETYVPLSFIEGTEGGLTGLLSDYYTKTEVDDTFVTKASLKGDLEGDDFVFVTAEKYTADQEALATYKSEIAEILAKTIKSDGDGTLDSIVVKLIKSEVDNEEQLVIDVKKDGLYVGTDKFTTKSELPVLITLTKAEYDALVENETLNEDAYYYVIDTDNTYVLTSYLELNYHTITLYQSYNASKYYDKQTIDQKLSLISTVNATVLEGYYTKTLVDEAFQTKSDLTTLLLGYVTKEMLGGAEGEEGDYIFVTNTQYQLDKQTQESSLETALATKVDKDSATTLKSIEVEEGVTADTIEADTSITTPKIINGQDFAELKNGTMSVNNKEVALLEDLTPMIVMSRQEYDEMDPEDRNPDAYYYLYNTLEEDALVTASQLDNYYTKSQIDSKLVVIAQLSNQIRLLTNRLAAIETTLYQNEVSAADPIANILNGDEFGVSTTKSEAELLTELNNE